MMQMKLWRIARSPNLVPRESETPAPRGGPVAAPWSSCRPMSVHRWALLLTVAAVIAMAGCRGATPATDPAPPAPPDPAALLTGTWVQTSYYDEDGRQWRNVEVLTFTAAGRAILAESRYADGALAEQLADSAGWEATDSTVTQITYDDDDDDPETPAVRHDLVKHYRWDGEALLMNKWGDSRAQADDFDTYTRVADPLAGLIGATWEWRRNEGARTATSTLTLNADGTFAHTRTVVGDSTVWTLAGSYRWDAAALAAVAGDDLTLTEHPPGGEPQTDPWTATVDPYRYAFAPTDDPDVIVVSAPHLDQTQPYGRYIDYYDRTPGG